MNENTMKEITMTEDAALEILDEARVQYQLESYYDYATICAVLAQVAEASLAMNDPNDDEITRANLQELQSVMHNASKLFYQCDPYYRPSASRL